MIADSFLFLLALSTFRLALPLMLTAVGGYFSEKSGVPQIGLEAFLLVGAFAAATTTYFSKSLVIGYVSAGFAAFILAQLFCWLVLKFKGNAIVIGTGLNLFVIGLIPLLSKTIFDSTGSTPGLTGIENSLLIPLLILLAVLTFSFYLSEKTVWGLQMKFAGEQQQALAAVGVSAVVRQWQSVSYGAFVTGLAGAILSTYLASSYSPLMSAGRGYIALAAVIFAGWNLRKAVFISLFFGFCEAIQIQAQSNATVSSIVPGEFIQMIPYVMTLLALAVFKSKQHAPKELK